MDHDLIYAKTASGEGAMLQRTRVMQRNVRMVLILVDSQSTVGDLCLKTGNPQLTEDALRELEKGGFIEPRAEDSLWEEGNRVAQEIRAAASNNRMQFEASRPKSSSEPSSTGTPPLKPAPIETQLPSDWSISKFSPASGQSEPQSAPPPAPFFVGDGAAILADEGPSGQKIASIFARIKAFLTRPASNAGRSEPTFVESLRPVPPSQGWLVEESKSVARARAPAPSEGRAGVSLKPIRRGRGPSMGWPTIAFLSIAGVLALVVLATFLFPYGRYLPAVEAALADATGRPVSIGSMRVEVYPKPVLLLGDVRIGNEQGAMRISEIRLQPELDTLMAGKKVMREVVMSGVSLPAETVAGLRGVFDLSRSLTKAGVRHLALEQAVVSFGGLGFPEMDGEFKLSADTQLQSLALRSADRRLSLAVAPREQGLEVVLDGFGWRPAPDSPFVFDSLNLKGFVENAAFSISSMELRVFDGLIEGAAVLRADSKPSVVGEVTFKRVNAARFGGALGFGQQFSGETAGKLRFSTTADSWATIFSAIDGVGEFTMQRGSIHGIDLAEAARSVGKTPVQGGATQFENLSGEIRLQPANYRFSGLVLNSGLMQSTGAIDISKELNVSGKMELKMRGTVNQTRIPIAIGGSLKSPTAQAGRGG